ncbi:MAG: hypothetical protein ABEJ91_00900 [Candidatus Nanohaloarchaea archaeon]
MRHRKAVLVTAGSLFLAFMTAGFYYPGFLGPEVASALAPFLNSADSADQCTVVVKGCHGKRYAINRKYEGLYRLLNNPRGQCSLEMLPLDHLNYTVKYSDGECRLSAEVTDSCEEIENYCKYQRKILEENYG